MRLPAVVLSTSALLLAVSCSEAPPEPVFKEITVTELHDKIQGGWAGQMIGVSYGAPTEFRSNGRILPEEELPEWTPETIRGSINQDDIYVDMTFAQVLDDVGLDATTADFGAMFRDSQYRLWHANLVGRRNLRRGMAATESGKPENNIHANDIDFQIEADFIGLMTPGMPQTANDYCWRAGRVMNFGDGIYGGMFVSGMYAAAFFEPDPRKLVEAGLAVLPPESPYAQVIADTLAFSAEHPDDWTRAWQLIQDKWDRRDPCPEGALSEFNIDAKLNGAYIALGLLYGGGDIEKTIKISTRAGQDSDCNPASAAGVLGVALGYSRIPEIWTSGIPAMADEKFQFTDYSFRTIVESTTQRAVELIQRNGGQFLGEKLVVQIQEPVPAALETWDDYGSPAERIPVTPESWTITGNWTQNPPSGRATHGTVRSAAKGNALEVTFRGTGFILTGAYLTSGGMADVSLDGGPAETVDVYFEGPGSRGSESLFHRFGLADGEHTVRLVVRGEPYSGSTQEAKGRDIEVNDLIVFR